VIIEHGIALRKESPQTQEDVVPGPHLKIELIDAGKVASKLDPAVNDANVPSHVPDFVCGDALD